MKINLFNLKKHREQKVAFIPHIGGFALSETKSYKINENQQESVKTLLDNIKSGDVLGYELLKTSKSSSVHLIASSHIDTFLPETQPLVISTDPIDIKHMSLFTISLNKAACFPLRFDIDFSILSQINEIVLNQGESMYLQILLEKLSNDWKGILSKTYDSYLSGIDSPSSSKLIRQLQVKLNDWTNKIDDLRYVNSEIELFQSKLEQDGFRVLIRLGFYNVSHERISKINSQIMKHFRQTDKYNSWSINEVHFRKSSILEDMQLKRFPLLKNKYQILCTSEVLPLLILNPFEQPIKQVEEQLELPTPEKPLILSYRLPSLTHLPKGKLSTKDDSKQEEQINKALTRVGLLKDKKIKVISVQQGATTKKLTCSLPQGVKFSDFTKSTKDIQNELGYSNISIEQGSQAGTVNISIPKQQRDVVFLRDWLDCEEFKNYTKNHILPFFIGLDSNGNPVYEDLARVKHLLVAGATGSGKSVWLNQSLLTLLLTKTPAEMMMYIIDPKMVEFTQFEDFPHVQEVIIEPNETLVLLRKLVQEMNDRYKKFNQNQCRNIQQYNRKSKEQMKYIVVFIDEVADLFMSNKSIEEQVILLGQKARACGIHLVIATQRPSVDVITGLLKAQFPSRICFACSSTADYRTVLDSKPPYKLLGKGDAVAQLEGIEGLNRIQGAIIAETEDKELEVIEKIKDEWINILNGKEMVHELPEPDETPEPTLLERAKLFICEGEKPTLRSLAAHLKIRNEKAKEILETLVNEKWLTSPVNSRSGYQVIVDQCTKESFGKWFTETFDLKI